MKRMKQKINEKKRPKYRMELKMVNVPTRSYSVPRDRSLGPDWDGLRPGFAGPR